MPTTTGKLASLPSYSRLSGPFLPGHTTGKACCRLGYDGL
nr:MAG TPA: hypothetical protein [Caudoviricetes sp.]